MSDIKIKAELDSTQVTAGMARMRANAKEVGEELGKSVFGRDSSKAFRGGLVSAGVLLAGAGLAAKAIGLGVEYAAQQLKDFRDGLIGVNVDAALFSQIIEGTQKKVGKMVGSVLGAGANLLNKMFGTGSSKDILDAEMAYDDARKNELANLQNIKRVRAEIEKEKQAAEEAKKKFQSAPEVESRASKIRMLEAELSGEESIAKEKRKALEIDLDRADLESRYGANEKARYEAQVKTLEIKKKIKDIDDAAAKAQAEKTKEIAESGKKELEIQQQVADMRGGVHTSGMLGSGISLAGERAFVTGVDQKQLTKLTEQLSELRKISAKVTYGYVQK